MSSNVLNDASKLTLSWFLFVFELGYSSIGSQKMNFLEYWNQFK